ncbi:MAG: site-specific integrase, partial [Thermodesulfovibrionales bacterium]|nr:site-specific integrase [Thermodesulfovibrionales bacterium]
SDYANLWIKTYAEPKLKPSSLKGYKDIVFKLLTPYFQDHIVLDITTGLLQKYISDRRAVVSGKTVCNEIVVIKKMFEHALKWGYHYNNPAENIERPKTEKKEIEILSPAEIDKLIENTHPNYKVAFLTCYLTGLRAGELWGLKWSDIDWVSKQIHVRRALWKKQFTTPKSKYSVRKVDITDSLIQELKHWKLASPINPYDVVFSSPEGALNYHDTVVKRYFNPALRRAGLRQVSFHSLRHSNASLRIHAGQNIKYIQQQMGHSSIKTTLDIYGHLFNDLDFNRQQTDLLENSVRNPLEKTQKIVKFQNA